MSEADEFFENELNSEKVIQVDKEKEEIICIGYRFKDKYYDEDKIDDCWVVFIVPAHHISIDCCIGMKELKAINLKAEELRLDRRRR